MELRLTNHGVNRWDLCYTYTAAENRLYCRGVVVDIYLFVFFMNSAGTFIQKQLTYINYFLASLQLSALLKGKTVAIGNKIHNFSDY